MTNFKNNAFFVLFGIGLVLYEIRLFLFRAYLFVMFAMRMGGAIVISIAAGGIFLALERMETNLLSSAPTWAFLPAQRFRDEVLALDVVTSMYDANHEYGYLIVTAILTVALFVAIRVATKSIAPVIFAFPMPRRPLPPELRWIPPEHKIEAVKATIAAPKRRVVGRRGDWEQVVKRLKPEIQGLLTPTA
ncbi:MAG: hypothetical protein WA790_02930 [Sulfitobacter sp.]